MAEVKVLLSGYLIKDSPSGIGSCSTVSLIKTRGLDGKNIVMVVDPGTVQSQNLIREALKKEGLQVKDVTHVGITHSHMDHFRNIGMFPNAVSVDFWGIWTDDECVYSNENEIIEIGDGLKTVKTPGHSYCSITFLVETSRARADGEIFDAKVAVCGDVFWKENYPEVEDDSYAGDREKLKLSRKKVLEMADYIIPGHGDEYCVPD